MRTRDYFPESLVLGIVLGVASYALLESSSLTVRLFLALLLFWAVYRLRTVLREERKNSWKDPLTGLPSVKTLYEFATLEINRARRYKQPLSLIYIDLDNFKCVNDSYGHQNGDVLLCVVADTLRNRIRSTDLVARLGGDEFVILLPQTPPEAVRTLVESLQTELLSAMNRTGWPVTFSMGVAVFLNAPEKVDDMLRKADDLMQTVKHGGKNTLAFEVISA